MARSDRRGGGGLPGGVVRLRVEPNVADADEWYAELLAAHEGLSEAEGHALDARLVLILANHVGDRRVLREALELAVSAGGAPSARRPP